MDIIGLGNRNAYRDGASVKKHEGGISFGNFMEQGRRAMQKDSVERSVPEQIYYAMYGRNAANIGQNASGRYEECITEHYRIAPDNEAGCFDIYDKQGNRLGVFSTRTSK